MRGYESTKINFFFENRFFCNAVSSYFFFVTGQEDKLKKITFTLS